MEIDLLVVLSNKDKYDKYIGYVPKEHLTTEVAVILSDMDKYYKNFGRTYIDWDDFKTYFKMFCHPRFKSEELRVYETIMQKAKNHTVDPQVEQNLLVYLIDKDAAAGLIEAGTQVLDGTGDFTKVEQVLDRRTHLVSSYTKDTRKTIGGTLSSLFDATYRHGGIEWRLEDLNISIGPLHRGDLIVVAARPDTGKTTFVTSELTHMATQLPKGKQAVIFNNEEMGEKIGIRMYQSALGLTTQDLLADENKAQADYVKALGSIDRIVIVDAPYLTVQDVEKICVEIDPGIIVFNTLPKIKGFNKSNNEVERQTELAQWARELAKTYGPTFSVMQAGEQAENSKWITQDMLYGSKTGVPGEADAIIGIGALHGIHDKRYLHVPKNKMPEGPRSQKMHRKIKSEVAFHGDIARYESLMFTKNKP